MITTPTKHFEVRPGNLIMSGPAAGACAVERGDGTVGRIAGVGAITIRVV
jgi:2-keto-4-pentenoate hydratase/2-oxohepta-3-ene-1,7-dioic acid hydratase in catechol pathway